MASKEAHAPHEGVPLKYDESGNSFEEERGLYHHAKHPARRPWLLYISLAISILANIALLLFVLNPNALSRPPQERTRYAGLARDVPTQFQSHSPFGLGSKTEAERSILWESLDSSAGEISLDNEEARAMGLPESSPFFWDESRSIYLVNAHHNMHCLRKVRRWITLSQYGKPQLDSYPHLVHCMDHLLQNIQCEADDTPMYTSPTRNVTTGDGQTRMCRSWDGLDAWAREQTACFAYVNETQGVGAVLDRFRYCPRDSPLLAPMREYFGYAADWWKPAPRDVDTMPKYWEGLDDGEIGY